MKTYKVFGQFRVIYLACFLKMSLARGPDGHKVVPRREHVVEALAQVQGSEEENVKAAAQCGLAGPSVALQ